MKPEGLSGHEAGTFRIWKPPGNRPVNDFRPPLLMQGEEIAMKTWILGSLSAVAPVLSGCAGFYGPGPGRGPGMMGYGMYGYGGIMWLIVIALAIVAIYIFVRLAGKGRAVGGVTTETPLEILKKRYARGEISREQFEEMKKDIGT